jgi:hypothetical protein
VALRQARPSGPANPSWIEIERADGAKLRLPDINPSEAFALFLGGRT